ncbi:MAG TPA: MFS transporter [Cytophagaceae bacterium]|nr:MFS transporter [Cytophagaceae bacterium]
MSLKDFKLKDVLNATVIVAALGYFVDVYDLVLFLIIGGTSLQDLGISSENSVPDFQYLLDIQMIGMLIGGVFWGILGDKKGRLSVLFGSIILYSLANVANGLVAELSSVTGTPVLTMYSILRFIAGFGLAGELGAGITLVSEIMDKKTRGFGTMIIASVGVTGAVVAALVGKLGWELAYFIGGGLGFSLLLLRIGVIESGMFKNIHHQDVRQGSFFFIFKNKERTLRYINSILIGLLVWFIIGILIGRAPVIAGILKVEGKIDKGFCVMMCYAGLVFGDICSGMISQVLKSRKKSLFIFYGLCLTFVLIYLNLYQVSSAIFYSVIFCLGFSVGFWAVFVTMASEQFGTNLRATVTTTVPNFVRGSLVLVALFFDTLAKTYDIITTAYIVTIVLLVVSSVSLFQLKETFGKDLNYLEE